MAVDWKEWEARVERSVGDPDENSADKWSTAGIRDCWLGGSHHTVADSEVAERILVGAPQLPYVVRMYRALLRRMVSYLVGAGVRQFLDLGSGLPTAGNVHQVAQDLDPRCRVVYVDIAADIVAESAALLAGNDNAAVVCADLRRPKEVFDAAQRCRLLDLDAPVAVFLLDVLHLIPDTDDPIGFISTYVDAVCPGSYVSITHHCDDEDLAAGLEMFHKFYHVPIPQLTSRKPAQIAAFFSRLDLVEPGIVHVPLWRPEQDEEVGTNPEYFPGYCGLGRKPGQP